MRVSLQYDVEPAQVEEFLAVMQDVRRQRRRNGATHWTLETAAPAGNGGVSYLEMIRYRSVAEYTRQPARMTKHDLGLLEKAREFHVGERDLSGRGEILAGPDADPNAELKAWASNRLGDGFDRFFEETAKFFDRFADLRAREKQLQRPKYREVRIRLPE